MNKIEEGGKLKRKKTYKSLLFAPFNVDHTVSRSLWETLVFLGVYSYKELTMNHITAPKVTNLSTNWSQL